MIREAGQLFSAKFDISLRFSKDWDLFPTLLYSKRAQSIRYVKMEKKSKNVVQHFISDYSEGSYIILKKAHNYLK